ncbi:MAG: hypothetical protein JNJ55_03790 [Betaproteobacteria bacterium]|nr:hypothetical protein [Betaproteobacteria bacterium]
MRSDKPVRGRAPRVIFAIALAAWAMFGISTGKLLWLGRFESNIYVTGLALWLMAGAMFVAATGLILSAASPDRQGRAKHAPATKWLYIGGWAMFFASIFAMIFM